MHVARAPCSTIRRPQFKNASKHALYLTLLVQCTSCLLKDQAPRPSCPPEPTLHPILMRTARAASLTTRCPLRFSIAALHALHASVSTSMPFAFSSVCAASPSLSEAPVGHPTCASFSAQARKGCKQHLK